MPDDSRGASAVPALFEISTDLIPASDRFEYFCESARSKYFDFDTSSRDSSEFYGRMKGSTAGNVMIAHTALSPTSWGRSRRSVLDHDESVILIQTTGGFGRLHQAGKDIELNPGSLALYVSTMPGVIDFSVQNSRVSVKFPRAMVETLLSPGHPIAPTLFQPDEPVTKMLAGYIGSYMREFEQMSIKAGQVAGRHIADLVALSLGAHRDGQVEIADGGFKAAGTEMILHMIARDFASPLVSPAAIGEFLRISERHVHRLLEESNRTFYEHLLEARLSNAFQLLTGPRATSQSITEIATQSGFTNISYFNRVFRQRFGDTPSGVRSTQSQ